jgi:hypothetical protein
MSPFGVVEGFTSDSDDNMFADVTAAAPVTAEEVEVVEEVEVAEAPVEEPKKKVVKQKSSAPKDEADLSAIVDGWDD